jgi:5-methylcytosine-specific restriction endonuclease McrA
MDSTLLLNADAMPINLLPLSSVVWEEAIKSIWVGDAEALHHYEEWSVHSPSVTLQVPSVIILKQQVQVKRNLRLSMAGPTSSLVYLRDGYQCQYCREVFPQSQLTMDHVLPRKFGGRTRWDNIASACGPCNCKRGHDVSVRPMTQPYRPTYSHLVKMMKKFPIIIPHLTWNYYLGWDENRVKLVDPQSGRTQSQELYRNLDVG